MAYFVQAEVKFRGRWKRLYLWRHDLWRESRSEAQLFATEAEAEAAVARLQASERKLRQVMLRPRPGTDDDIGRPASDGKLRIEWANKTIRPVYFAIKYYVKFGGFLLLCYNAHL